MGTAYIRFAITEPAHYRIMFGQYRALCESDAALAADAAASFEVLLDALAALERDGAIPVAADRAALGRYVWATVHGVAMLSIDGQLGPDPAAADALTALTLDRITAAIAGESSGLQTCRRTDARLEPDPLLSCPQPARRPGCSASRSCPPGTHTRTSGTSNRA